MLSPFGWAGLAVLALYLLAFFWVGGLAARAADFLFQAQLRMISTCNWARAGATMELRMVRKKELC